MTKLAEPKPHKVSVTVELPNVAKFIKSAAEEFSEKSSWLDMTRLQDSLNSDSESLVNQINEDLEWLRIKLKKAQNYEHTKDIVRFEKKLIKRVIKLNQYADRFEAAITHFNALTWNLSEFDVEQDALAIKSAKRKWKKLEKNILKRLAVRESNLRSMRDK